MITLCVAYMIKNETNNIEYSLDSIKTIADKIIIVDTGSTDDTIDKIRNFCDKHKIEVKIYERPWMNFGYNRSELALLARNEGEYCLFLDADMTINLNNFNKEELTADAYDILINWGIIYYLPLLLNNRLEWKSIGCVHEYWQAEGMISHQKIETITINHNRYCSERKNDINLLLEGIKNEPNNTRYMFYLCRSYLETKEYEKAIEWGKKRIFCGGWKEEIYHSMLSILISKINLNKSFEEILEDTFNIYFYNPSNAEPLYYILNYCRIKKLFNIGYYIGKIAEKIIMPTNQTLFVDKTIYDYKIDDELSICAYYIEKYQESLDLCNQILQINYLSENDRNRIIQNKWFCEQKLGINYNLDKFKQETAEEIKNLNYKKYFYQFNEQEKIMFAEELKNTADFFENKFNLKVYPVYGTLLGIIRDNDFIAHDTDMDMAYLSNFHTPEEVSQEFRNLCKKLTKYNMLMKNFEPPSHIHIYSPSKKMRFDMWISWIDKNNNYHLVWTVGGDIDGSMILPFKTIEFKNQIFTQMNDPERFLNAHYGNWKIPVGGTAKEWNKRKFIFELEPWHGK